LPRLKRIWIRFKSGLASAFKVEPENLFVPNQRQQEIVDKLAGWVVRRRLTLPAVMTLESVTPLNYLGSQAMVFFQPFITVFLNPADYKEFQQMLEYRESIKWVIQTIESHEDEWNEKRAKPAPPSSESKE
jgi:hypothetical protein